MTATKEEAQNRLKEVFRWIVAGAFGTLVVVYLILILSQKIPPASRLGGVEVGLILGTSTVIALLAKPDLLKHIKSLKTSWFEVEVRERLEVQAQEIDNVKFMLSLLIPKPELEHLKNLRKPGRVSYEATPNTLTELRRLRDFQLVRMNPGQTIGELAGRKDFDLNAVMKLTEKGQYLLLRLDEHNTGKAADGAGVDDQASHT
jgi:hypothetical protein